MIDIEELKKFIPDGKRPKGGETSHELAEIFGWNSCILEIYSKIMKAMGIE